MNARELNRATLARQLLLAREPVGVGEAVERLGGLQAQEARPPFLALWSRIEGFERDDLHGALGKGTVVRAMLMRATLHVVSRKHYAALRPVLDDVMTRAMTGALKGRDQGLDLGKVLPAAERLLAKRPRTFNELRAELSEKFPKVNERALGYAVRTQLPLAMVPSDDDWAFPRDAEFALATVRLAQAGPEGARARSPGRVRPSDGGGRPALVGDAGHQAGAGEHARPARHVRRRQARALRPARRAAARRRRGGAAALPAGLRQPGARPRRSHARDRRRAQAEDRVEEPADPGDGALGWLRHRDVAARAQARRRDAGDEAVREAALRRKEGARA